MIDDLELLRAYTTGNSEDAFRSLLERHMGLVYSAALRQVRNPHLAEEITQVVFILLARKANSLRPGTVLVGWLFRTTRFVAARAVRGEQRRQRREQEAAQMQSDVTPPAAASWDEIAPTLDEALASLREAERQAVLLRFFEKKNLKDVGRVLGSKEDAVQKRITRALEKLRTFLFRRGIALSSAALAGALAENSVHAAPASLSTSIFAAVTANSGTASTLALLQGSIKAMLYVKLKTATLAATFVLLIGGGGLALTPLFRSKPTTQFVSFPLENLDGKPLASYGVENDWSIVPTGNQIFGGVPFRVATKLQLHGNSDAKDGRYYPSRVIGIPVHERLARLHLLHAANIPGTEGRPVAALRFNYAGGKTHTLFVVYGIHTRDWWKFYGEPISGVTDTNTSLAWTGRADPDPWKGSHRIFQTAFDLPASDQPLETIDALSLFADSSFIVVAMTGERWSRESHGAPWASADESQFRAGLRLKVTDRAGDIAAGVSVRGLAVGDRGQPTTLGKMDDSFGETGIVPVDFPAGTCELRLFVSTANREVTEVNLQIGPGQTFPRELTARLEPGVRIGGLVLDLENRPVEKAKVEIFRSAPNSKGELLFSRLFETRSDVQGRWRVQAAPTSLDGLVLRITHSDFKSNQFELVGESSRGSITREALLASRAEFKLAPTVAEKGSRQIAQPGSPAPEKPYPERIPAEMPAVVAAHEACLTGDVSRLKEILDEHPEYLNQFIAQNTATLLHSAVYNSQLEIVEELLRRKADVNVRNTAGATPLHDCASKGNEKIAALLLAAGADVTLRNGAGFTPAEWAVQKNRPEMAEFLRKQGARASAGK